MSQHTQDAAVTHLNRETIDETMPASKSPQPYDQALRQLKSGLRGKVMKLCHSLSSFSEGVYVNFLMKEGEQRIHQAYPPATYERLVALKRRYDPTNLFHLNQNIKFLAL